MSPWSRTATSSARSSRQPRQTKKKSGEEEEEPPVCSGGSSSSELEHDEAGCGSDDDEESADEEEEDEEEEEEEEEESDDGDDGAEEVGIGRSLPTRNTRGARFTQMVGETIRKDSEFWNHETWKEEEDDDYKCSEGEEQYKDTVDSDFDQTETEEESEESGDGDDDKPSASKSKPVYVDPNLRRKRTAAQPKARKKKGRDSTETHANNARAEDEATGFTVGAQRSKRATTQKRTETAAAEARARELKRQKIAADKKRRAVLAGDSDLEVGDSKVRSVGKRKREPTQAEHLAEAEITEKQNSVSLKYLEAWELERRQYGEYKSQKTYKGHYEMYISWASDRVMENDQEEPEKPENEAEKSESVVCAKTKPSGDSSDADASEQDPASLATGTQVTDDLPKHGNYSSHQRPGDSTLLTTDGTIAELTTTNTTATNTNNTLSKDDDLMKKIPKKRKTPDDEEGSSSSLCSFSAAECPREFSDGSQTFPSSADASAIAAVSSESQEEEENEVYCQELLFFTDGKLPEMYTAVPPVRKPQATCVVTGSPASYRDPLTRLAYADKHAFKAIRQWYFDAMDKHVLAQLEYVETLLAEKATLSRELLKTVAAPALTTG